MVRLILLMSFPVFLAAQGPLDGYLKGKGVLDLVPSFSFNRADKFFGPDNQVYEEPYRGQLFSLFTAYGLTRRIDLVGTAAVVFNPLQSGLQDGGLFLKYRPVYKSLGQAGKLGILLGSGAMFPISRYEPVSTGALGQRAISVPVKGIVQWETPLGPFVNITYGYHFRVDKLSAEDISQIQVERPDYQPIEPGNFSTLLFKVGLPTAHFYADAWYEIQRTRTGSDYVPDLPDLAQSFRVSYTQIGGTIYYSDSGKSGFFLSGGYILGGRNVNQIQRITVGVVFKVNTQH